MKCITVAHLFKSVLENGILGDIFRDDFMLGAKLKDWDQESDGD